jgi:hypothetical protein
VLSEVDGSESAVVPGSSERRPARTLDHRRSIADRRGRRDRDARSASLASDVVVPVVFVGRRVISDERLLTGDSTVRCQTTLKTSPYSNRYSERTYRRIFRVDGFRIRIRETFESPFEDGKKAWIGRYRVASGVRYVSHTGRVVLVSIGPGLVYRLRTSLPTNNNLYVVVIEKRHSPSYDTSAFRYRTSVSTTGKAN